MAVRLAVVGLSLAGIIAMHGLSVTDGSGMHRSPVGLDQTVGATHGAPDAHGAPSASPATPACGTGHDCHAAMASCLAILLGLIGLATLQLHRLSGRLGGPLSSFRRALAPSAARAPPQPIFLSLCVFRT